MQKIIGPENHYYALDLWIREKSVTRLFLVCDSSLEYQKTLKEHFLEMEQNGIQITRFSDFQPNPQYASAVKGVLSFRSTRCNGIMAVGGGSAIDVAKCIKLYSFLRGDGEDGSWLREKIVPNEIPFLAMPTTAGTGSEATRYSVVYFDGEKQSITADSCIPETVLLDPDALKALPLYQRKSTMLDALCHAVESFWSVHSTEESRAYSRTAIRLVFTNMENYLANTRDGNAGMMIAAHTAGKAINIAQTTAGHAMCYKLTSLYGVSHGHAAALCNRILFPWMLDNVNKCIDPRGKEFLTSIFQQIAEAMGCENEEKAARELNDIFDRFELEVPVASEAEFMTLKESVNPVRLKNHPVLLEPDTIDLLYHRILKKEIS